jgi:hypothetical protein
LLAWWWAAWIAGQLVPLIGFIGWGFPEMMRFADAVPDGATSFDLGGFMRPILPWIVLSGVFQAMAGLFASQVIGRIDEGQRAMAADGVAPLPPRPDLHL